MALLDVVVVALMVLSARAGYRIGFVARVASWIGLLGGYYLALRLLPFVLDLFSLPTMTGRTILVITSLTVGTFAGLALGLLLGNRLSEVVPPGPAQRADRVIGGVAGALVIILALWLVVSPLADIPGWSAHQARNSAFARGIHATLPEAPDATRTVRSLIDEQSFPRVFEAIRPAPDSGAAPVASGLDPQVEDTVARSTVKVMGEGKACRQVQEGSGFVVSEDVVVTNAHVVAGVDQVDVVRPDGKRLDALVALFDPNRDLAVLTVDKLRLTPLRRGLAEVGSTGAVFGHPGGQAAVRAAPARISDKVPALGRDIYDRKTSERQVFILAANLRPGDSGAALVNKAGEVVGVAFAIAPDRRGTAYALTDQELDAALEEFERRPKARPATGPCVD